jgi:hypothetical protein
MNPSEADSAGIRPWRMAHRAKRFDEMNSIFSAMQYALIFGDLKN